MVKSIWCEEWRKGFGVKSGGKTLARRVAERIRREEWRKELIEKNGGKTLALRMAK